MSMARLLHAAGFEPAGPTFKLELSEGKLALMRDRALLRMKSDPEYAEVRAALARGEAVDLTIGDAVLGTITPDDAREFGLIP